MNLNDYKDGNGNVEVSETLVGDLIGGINTNESGVSGNTSAIATNTANIATNATAIASLATKVVAGETVNPLTVFKSMANGSLRIGWGWAVTTADNWPAQVSGYNNLVLFRGSADFGLAIAVMGNSKTYTATVRDGLSTIVWTILN